MITISRRLQGDAIQQDLRPLYDSLLAGLNGQLRSEKHDVAQPGPLPASFEIVRRVESVLKDLKVASRRLEVTVPGINYPTREELINRVNKRLTLNLQFPVCFVDPLPGKLTYRMEPCDCDPWEGDAIQSILGMLKHEQLFRLERCASASCGRWFYMIRPGKRFCSTACRQKEHRHNPESRTKRAKYMRKYRSDEKKLNEHSLTQVRHVLNESTGRHRRSK